MNYLEQNQHTREMTTAAGKISRLIDAHPEDILIQSTLNKGEDAIGSMWIVFQQKLQIPEDHQITGLAIHVCPQNAGLEIRHDFETHNGVRTSLNGLYRRSSPFDELHTAHLALLEKARQVAMDYGQLNEAMLLRRLQLNTRGIGFPVFDERHWSTIKKIVHEAAQFETFPNKTKQFDVSIPSSHWAGIASMEGEDCVYARFIKPTSSNVRVRVYEQHGRSRVPPMRVNEFQPEGPDIEIETLGAEELMINSDAHNSNQVGGFLSDVHEHEYVFQDSAPTRNGITGLRIISLPDEMIQDMKRFVPEVPSMPMFVTSSQ